MEEPRYSRIERIEIIGPEGLAVLRKSTAAVLGLGNIGGEVARHLVMLGIRVRLVDRDVVKEENLGTQGFIENRLGLPKVEARAKDLSRLNPSCHIETLYADVDQLGLGALQNANLIFCCLDSRQIRTVVNEIATRLGIPWVDAAVDGSGKSHFGRVAAYDPRSSDSPCYLCPHDRGSLREIMREGLGDSCPVWQWNSNTTVTAPTLTISALGSAVAAAQVIWGLKILLGRGEKVTGTEMYMDFGRNVLTTHTLKRNPNCLFDHKGFQLTSLGRTSGGFSLQELGGYRITTARCRHGLWRKRGASFCLLLRRTSLCLGW